MGRLKSVFIVIGALAPIIYCGSLLHYFVDLSGSVQEARVDGLGPTLMGLGIVGLLFCVSLLIKLVRIFARPRPPGSGGSLNASTDDDESGFDADAAIARYMAQRSTETAANALAVPARPSGGGAARRPGFGRKVR